MRDCRPWEILGSVTLSRPESTRELPHPGSTFAAHFSTVLAGHIRPCFLRLVIGAIRRREKRASDRAADAEQVARIVERQHMPMHGRVEELALLRRDGDRLETIESYRLG